MAQIRQGMWRGKFNRSNPPPGYLPGELQLRQQPDYDGSTQTVDVGIYTVRFTCSFPGCKSVRYVKPQDAFHCRYCKPHTRRSRGRKVQTIISAAKPKAKAKRGRIAAKRA